MIQFQEVKPYTLDVATGTLLDDTGNPVQNEEQKPQVPPELEAQITALKDKGIPSEKVIKALRSGKIQELSQESNIEDLVNGIYMK